ncbi:hypothetical protein E2562_037694 [Oryza meyeriana var. granulata]|uniref:Uncharacterized protein n=1 Tax=Oryza meyeriana var. granulata TaxID=110450 RepID=A0A6G1ECK7_9ORYZ|nr:hypothetical protein E2562_037694 [Oryza meyeriana var. granulata]
MRSPVGSAEPLRLHTSHRRRACAGPSGGAGAARRGLDLGRGRGTVSGSNPATASADGDRCGCGDWRRTMMKAVREVEAVAIAKGE